MTAPLGNDLERGVRTWMTNSRKETSRLEFKLRIVLDTCAAKAEFIRDVIALANSEGEFPRTDGFLVIGFKNGKRRDVTEDHYDGATFGQILDSYVYPSVVTEYREFGSQGRTGVLVIKANPDALHAVSKRLLDERGQPLLLPGQSWGRKSDRKIELAGEGLDGRFRKILERKVNDETAPLYSRIERLERASGPNLR